MHADLWGLFLFLSFRDCFLDTEVIVDHKVGVIRIVGVGTALCCERRNYEKRCGVHKEEVMSHEGVPILWNKESGMLLIK